MRSEYVFVLSHFQNGNRLATPRQTSRLHPTPSPLQLLYYSISLASVQHRRPLSPFKNLSLHYPTLETKFLLLRTSSHILLNLLPLTPVPLASLPTLVQHVLSTTHRLGSVMVTPPVSPEPTLLVETPSGTNNYSTPIFPLVFFFLPNLLNPYVTTTSGFISRMLFFVEYPTLST